MASLTAVGWNSKTPGKFYKSFATSDSIFTARAFPFQSEIHMGEEGYIMSMGGMGVIAFRSRRLVVACISGPG